MKRVDLVPSDSTIVTEAFGGYHSSDCDRVSKASALLRSVEAMLLALCLGAMMKILIAGVGNLLLGDDGFGVEVAKSLIERGTFAENVEVFEAGIAGIALVQELMNGYDALIVADAMDTGEAPGTVSLIEPSLSEFDAIDPTNLHHSLVDAHYAEPSKALLLAKALNVLPSKVFIIGCQPASCDEPGADLSPPVANAVTVAIKEIDSLIEELNRN